MQYIKRNKRAFTLVEMMLVMVVIGILAGVLFKTYITMSQISFRIEQQKIVNKELLFVSEVLQNIANNNQIDYSKYQNNLVAGTGITNVLYMTGADGEISIFASGSCVKLDQVVTSGALDAGCSLFLNKDGHNIQLTDDGVYVTDVVFKIMPFLEAEAYQANLGLCNSNYLACVDDPGFWFLIKIYTRGYNSSFWTTNVSMFVQQFFNI